MTLYMCLSYFHRNCMKNDLIKYQYSSFIIYYIPSDTRNVKSKSNCQQRRNILFTDIKHKEFYTVLTVIDTHLY